MANFSLYHITIFSVVVEDYRAPYEEEVGIHPTIEDMRLCVLNNKTRPKLKDEWRGHDVSFKVFLLL